MSLFSFTVFLIFFLDGGGKHLLCIHNCDYASLCKAIQLVIPSILSTAAVIQRVYFLFDLTKIKIFSQWSIKLSEQSFPAQFCVLPSTRNSQSLLLMPRVHKRAAILRDPPSEVCGSRAVMTVNEDG